MTARVMVSGRSLDKEDIVLTPLIPHVFLVEGGNQGRLPYAHAFLVTGDTTLLIDTGCGHETIRAIRREFPPDMVINTHAHPDHTSGNGLLEGMLDLVPSARVAHIGLYRDHETLEPVEYYFKAPEDLADRLVIVVDPMLATANSAIAAVQKLKDRGAHNLRFLCLLAAPEGIEKFTHAHPDVPLVTAAIDEKLNDKGYIVPGLGDAGDRLYGTK